MASEESLITEAHTEASRHQIEEIPRKMSERWEQNDRSAQKSLSRLYLNVCVSATFMSGEIIGGVLSDSIAVLTDACHIFTDIIGFFIIIVSLHLTRRHATPKMTYGYHRAEVIGTLLSIVLIWGLTAWLVTEAVQRLITPQPVHGLIMLITACGGVIGNVIMGLVLILTDPDGSREAERQEKHKQSNSVPAQNSFAGAEAINSEATEKPAQVEQKNKMSLNIRAAFIHVLGDGIQSLGVAIAGIIVYLKPDYKQADPICTLMFCVIVLATTFPILGDCLKILMEASPPEVDYESMTAELRKIQEVIDVHDVHVWSLSSGKLAASCHLVSNDADCALEKGTTILKDMFNIGHVTIQIESRRSGRVFECQNDLH